DGDELVDAARPRLQQERVDQREHRRVRTNAEREDDDRHGGEAGRAPEEPDAVAGVLNQLVHDTPYDSRSVAVPERVSDRRARYRSSSSDGIPTMRTSTPAP